MLQYFAGSVSHTSFKGPLPGCLNAITGTWTERRSISWVLGSRPIPHFLRGNFGNGNMPHFSHGNPSYLSVCDLASGLCSFPCYSMFSASNSRASDWAPSEYATPWKGVRKADEVWICVVSSLRVVRQASIMGLPLTKCTLENLVLLIL